MAPVLNTDPCTPEEAMRADNMAYGPAALLLLAVAFLLMVPLVAMQFTAQVV